METSFLKNALALIKNNFKWIIIGIIFLFFVVYLPFRELVIKKQAIRLADYENTINSLEEQRQDLQKYGENLAKDNLIVIKQNDSLKLLLIAKQKALSDFEKIAKHTIDSLLKIPNDTVFIRLQAIFPNYDASPLEYPFSGSQIHQIYSDAISFPLLAKKYQIQKDAFNTCLDLNTGYEKSIGNYKSQLANMEEQIGKCDQQNGLYQKQVNLLLKNNKKDKFWNRVLIGTNLATFIYAITK